MFAGIPEVGAIAGALNFDEPLGAAADRANLFVERRAAATRAASAAEGTDHVRIIV